MPLDATPRGAEPAETPEGARDAAAAAGHAPANPARGRDGGDDGADDDGADTTSDAETGGEANAEDFRCALCLELMFKPTTTSCGHSFCSLCLQRAFEHNDDMRATRCPLCTAVLPRPMGPLSVAVDLNRLLRRLFPEETAARRREVAADQRAADAQRRADREQLVAVPCFVLMPILPRQHLQLHIFELRYRRMIEASLEGDRRFGLVPHRGRNAHENYGTIVRIVEYERLPGGRFFVEVVGERVFHIASSTPSPEGYLAAQVRFVEPDHVQDESETPGVDAARVDVIALYNRWRAAMAAYTGQDGPPDIGGNLTLIQPGELAMRIAAQLNPVRPQAQLGPDIRNEMLAAATSLPRLLLVRAALERSLADMQPTMLRSLVQLAVTHAGRAARAAVQYSWVVAVGFITHKILLDNGFLSRPGPAGSARGATE